MKQKYKNKRNEHFSYELMRFFYPLSKSTSVRVPLIVILLFFIVKL